MIIDLRLALKAILYIILIFQLTNASKTDEFPYLSRIHTSVSDNIQGNEAFGVIKRIIPDKAHFFDVIVNSKNLDKGIDRFEVVKIDGRIQITGTSGVAVTWGFHHYLKFYCNAHIGWKVKQVNLPDVLPAVNISIVAQDKFRYYQNVCTTSYSFVWWDFNEWRNHIDWMALNGINLALASHGQEAIWQRVYRKLNLTEEEIQSHFSGPAFLSWLRMGNLRGWGGPLSIQWHETTLNLQHFILDAMKNLGITPVLPAFSGHVPKAFKRLFPSATMTDVEPWNRFNPDYCCPLYLDPTDPLFGFVGRLFMSEIINEFDLSTNVYNSDPFNELKPSSDDPAFLKAVGSAIFNSMVSIDPNAVWLLQNWMFVHEFSYWTHPKVEAFLTSVPLGRLLILDLQSEQWPQYDRFEMYYSQPFIWCMLHNFGGTLGMFGDTQSINNDVYTARHKANSTMIGVGLTPEGINQNYALYDLMLETAIRDKPVDLDSWARKYSIRRYGASDDNAKEAWSFLMKSVYNYTGLNKMRGKYVVNRRPSLDIKIWSWYSGNDLMEAWKHLLAAQETLNSSHGYRHDLVDVTRQSLQYLADQAYPLLIQAFKEKNVTKLDQYSSMILQVIKDLEDILATSEDFLLGSWLESAKSLSKNEKDKKLFEYNARNQITLWGPNGEIVDYASKQWSGIVKDFFLPRWKAFLSAMADSVKHDYKFNKTAVVFTILETIEKPFTFSNKVYPTESEGDTVQISQMLYNKWINSIEALGIVPINIIKKPSYESRTSNHGGIMRLVEEEDIDNYMFHNNHFSVVFGN